MKLCVDCKWYRYRSYYMFSQHRCTNSKLNYVSPVTGDISEGVCNDLRESNKDCPEFEKGNWWNKLKNKCLNIF